MKIFFLLALFVSMKSFAGDWEYISDNWTYARGGKCKATSIKVFPNGKFTKVYCGKTYEGTVPSGMMEKVSELVTAILPRYNKKIVCDEAHDRSVGWNVQFKLPGKDLRQMFYQDGAVCYRGGDLFYHRSEDSIYENMNFILLDIATNI